MATDRGNTDRGNNGRFTKTLESAERDAKACEMKGQGYTYQQISDELGYGNRSHAYRAVSRALAEIPRESARELRQLQLDELDYFASRARDVLEREHLTISQGGKVVHFKRKPVPDDAPILAAIDRLLRIQERRAKLMGLDAPTRREVITLDAIDAEIARLQAELDDEPDLDDREAEVSS